MLKTKIALIIWLALFFEKITLFNIKSSINSYIYKVVADWCSTRKKIIINIMKLYNDYQSWKAGLGVLS